MTSVTRNQVISLLDARIKRQRWLLYRLIDVGFSCGNQEFEYLTREINTGATTMLALLDDDDDG